MHEAQLFGNFDKLASRSNCAIQLTHSQKCLIVDRLPAAGPDDRLKRKKHAMLVQGADNPVGHLHILLAAGCSFLIGLVDGNGVARRGLRAFKRF